MYLLSLIVPIYNSEEYIDNLINSIINQSIGFDNIELILVDDLSTDNSKKIIEDYSKKYNNIIPYYSNINHGFPGFGRNMGIGLSTTEYVMFIDHDDELDKDVCKNFYETITNENADLVCCDIINNDPLGVKKENIPYVNGIETEKFVIIKDDDIPLFGSISIWNKLFKKEIITENQIKFIEWSYADDLTFSLSYFLKSKTLIYLKDYFGYKWNNRPTSLSHTVAKEHLIGLINAYRDIIVIFKKENKVELANTILKRYIGYLIIQCSYVDADNAEIEKILKEIHDFEIEIGSNELTGIWAKTVNYFILNENYTIARIILKITDKIRKIEILRKISRKIS